MNRYVRLGYLLPRVVVVVALVVGLQYAAGWALRWAVVDGGQSLTGAKVEIDKSAVALLDTRVTLQGIRAADPRDPMRNLFEAEVAEFDLDADALLRRTAVAERGVVRGLRFGGGRDTSGALEDTEGDAAEAAAWPGLPDDQAVKKLLAPWANNLRSNATQAVADDLESVRLAEQIAEQWPERYEELRQSASRFRADVEAFEQAAKLTRQNPLRHARLLAELPGRATDLQQRLAALHTEISALPGDAIADRQRVAEAWRNDQQRLRERLSADQLDADSLTSALVGERVTSAVSTLLDGVRWVRKFVPANASNEPRPARRGADVRFVGVKPRPDLLVRSLELSGVADFGSRPMEFAGLVTDLTTQPASHNEPTRLVVRTEGPTPLEAWATLDRSSDVAVDDLRVECPSLALPGERLPLGDGLALEIGPSAAKLTLQMRLEGERLTGDLRVVQDQLVLHTRTDDGASDTARRLASALEASLESVSNLDTSVTLAGTLERPRVGLRSNLGPAIAAAVRGSLNAIAQEQVAESLAAARGRIDAHLGKVDAVLAGASQRLSAELGDSTALLEQFAGATGGGGQGRLPFGLPRLGEQKTSGNPLFR